MKRHLLALVITCGTLTACESGSAALMVHYKFDQINSPSLFTPAADSAPANVIDSSSHGVNGLFRDGAIGADTEKAVAASGALGGAWNFDGPAGADIVEFQVGSLPASGQTALAGANARTIALWVNPDAVGDNRMFSYGANSGGNFFSLSLENDATLGNIVAFRRGAGFEKFSPSQVTNPIDVSSPDYLHVAAVVPVGAVNTTDLLIYVNGQLANFSGSSVAGAVALNTLGTNGTSYVGIGRRGNDNGTGGGQQNSFDGQIADFQFYDSALTGEQVMQLFTSPGSAIPEPGSGVLILLGLSILTRRRAGTWI